jgi:predicted nucleic acid-binding protein
LARTRCRGKGKAGSSEVERVRGEWLSVEEVVDQELVAKLTSEGLHSGEAEAIVLAEELTVRIVFMDDERGVRLARARGLEVVRTIAVYIAALRLGWIEAIRPKLDQLCRQGFHLREAHYRAILQDAGES